MPVFDLKQLSSEFAKAVNAGDLDSVCNLYAADAMFVTEPGGQAVSGQAAIREVLAGFLASKPVMDFKHTYMFENGDVALVRGEWKLTSKAADGSASVVEGKSVEVLRRQSDKSWRYIIDHPWGGN